jgi:hypothetical protein
MVQYSGQKESVKIAVHRGDICKYKEIFKNGCEDKLLLSVERKGERRK